MEYTSEYIQSRIDQLNRCEEEIGRMIVGQKDIVRQVILAILADGNVLLEGVPGLGKTVLVKTLAQVFDMTFSRIQFTPDLMPADVTGTNLIVKENGQNVFRFEPGPIFAHMVLADEINRATPKTQSALLEAMQEKRVTVGKQTYIMPSPFMVLATQNPIENEGTYPLPEAQLDRFLLKLLVEFPSADELKVIMDRTVSNNDIALSQVMTGDDVLEIRKLVFDMPMADAVKEYALKIVVGTHPEVSETTNAAKRYVLNGASPRAGQAIFKVAKAKALMEGRYNVSFDDIDSVALPALRHRLALNFDALSEGVTADSVIKMIIDEIKQQDR